MSESKEVFARLMERMRDGCPDAARELCERYSDHILRVVRRRLHQRLRTQFDSLDFTQAVWASFFTTAAQRCTFDDPDDLLGFLAQLATNKVAETFRSRMLTDKRNLSREVPLGGDALEGGAAPARQPTPSQELMARECWERLVAGQPEQYRQALELLRQGHSRQEIAERLHIHPKRLQRLLSQLEPKPERP